MMKKVFLFIFFSVFIVSLSYLNAQVNRGIEVQPEVFTKKCSPEYDFTNLGVKDGLPSTTVYKVIQTSRGDYWIAGSEGVCRYNGMEVSTFDKSPLVKDKMIWALLEDSKGRIWCGLDRSGVVFYDGDKFTNFDLDKELSNTSVRDIQEGPSGNLWFSTPKGLARYKNGKVEWMYNEWLDSGGVFKTYPHKDRLYICAERGLYYIENEKIKKYLPRIESLKKCRSLFIDDKGNHFIGTWGSGLYLHFPETDSVVNLYSELTNNVVWTIQEDYKGRVWLGTDKGINVYDNGQIYAITEQEGLSNDRVWSITADQTKRLWIACYGGGISVFNGDFFNYYHRGGGFTDKMVNAILKTSDGATWYATLGDGLIKLKDDTFTHYKDHSIFRDNNIWNLYEDSEGSLWICVDAALVKYENGRFYKYSRKNFTMQSGLIWSITEVEKGHYLVGTFDSGLMELKDNQFKAYEKNDELKAKRIYDLYKDSRGRIWVVASIGVAVIEGDSVRLLWEEHDVFANRVSAIKEDHEKNIWIASNKGVIIIPEQNDYTDYLLMDIGHGLPFDNIRNIQFIDETKVWLGTNEGICKVDYSVEDGSVKVNSTKIYTGSTGFREIEVTGTTDYNNPFSEYWFPTPRGAIAVKGEMDSFLKPSVSLKDIDLFYRDVNWEKDELISDYNGTAEYDSIDVWRNIPVDPVLSHQLNHLTFRYQGGNTRSVSELKYSFILDGFQNNWSPPSNSREAVFSNLKPGDYTFKVKAINENGISSEVHSYSFTIEPPYWELWWFRGSMALIFILLIISAFRWRTSQLRKNKESLEKLVNSRTIQLREQKNLLMDKNEKITDSINYAKRLQNAVLPPSKLLKQHLKEGFVLFKPKDIVSGDFYFMDVVEEKGKKLVYYVAADCTGHGVPGAMVSIVGANGLKRCIREFGLRKPGEILDQLSELVADHFSHSEEKIRDGMDLALCCVEFDEEKAVKVHYAGANNPLWIINPNRSEWPEGMTLFKEGGGAELKPTKNSVGYTENDEAFESHTVKIEKGDVFYTFTDGYPDQFGGEKGKKFKSANFKKLLLSIQDKAMEEQKEIIDIAFQKWKGDLEQVDDVCVIGVKVE